MTLYLLRPFVPVIPCCSPSSGTAITMRPNTLFTCSLHFLPLIHNDGFHSCQFEAHAIRLLSIMPSIIYHLQASVTNPKAPSLRHWWFFSLGYSRFRLDKNDESWIIFWAMPHLSSLQLPPVCLLIWGWRQNRWDLYHTSRTMAVGD